MKSNIMVCLNINNHTHSRSVWDKPNIWKVIGIMTNNSAYNPFEGMGGRIRMSRKYLGYTLSQAAELMNVSDVYLGMVERSTRTPSFKLLTKICSCYGVSADYILYGKESSLSGKRNTAVIGLLNDEKFKTIIKIALIIEKENVSKAQLNFMASLVQSFCDSVLKQ